MANATDKAGQRSVIGPKPEDPAPAPPGVRSVIGPKPEDPHSITEVAVPKGRAGGPGSKHPTPGGPKPG